MLNVEQIQEWLGQEVLDAEGETLGKLEDVYYARGSAEPQFALVKRGLLVRKHTVVPLQGAAVGRDHVRLAYSSEQVASASDSAGPEAGETLSGADSQRLGEAYGVTVVAGDLDSANALEQRRAAAEQAEARAAALEAEARERGEGADQAQEVARDQSAEASEAERAAQDARAEAERLAVGGGAEDAAPGS